MMEEGSNIETIIECVVEIYRFNELKKQQRVIVRDILSGKDVIGFHRLVSDASPRVSYVTCKIK